MGKIGLSLSFCIADICTGKVKIEDVEKIITGTRWPPEELEDRLVVYLKEYWHRYPDKAKEVFYELWNSGRIEQPRLNGDRPPAIINVREKRWV